MANRLNFTDDVESKMWRAYKKAKTELENRARFDKDGQRIYMLMSFEEYKKIWNDSGKWSQRGRKKDEYVLSRKNDIGHYEYDNVFIQTTSDNLKDRMTYYKCSDETKIKMSSSQIGKRSGMNHSIQTKIQMSLSRKKYLQSTKETQTS
jgi:hypothetical protein